MFVLEESQLVEDLIEDAQLLNTYQILKQNESSNDRTTFIRGILAFGKSVSLTEFLLEACEKNQITLNQTSVFENRLTEEERDALLDRIKLNLNDTAALILIMAASLNHLFVIDNFTGPTDSNDTRKHYESLPEVYKRCIDDIDVQSLNKDGTDACNQVTSCWLLRLAKLYWSLLDHLGCPKRAFELEFLVWRHRHLTTHLVVLVEPIETIMAEIKKIQEFIFDCHILNEGSHSGNNTQMSRFDRIELCCEIIQSALLRDGITTCRKIFDYASEYSGISIKHTGMLGRRTRYQQRDISQLVIMVNKSGSYLEKREEEDLIGLPNDVKLDDDTLLPEISFETEGKDSSRDAENEILSTESQLILLSRLDYLLKTEVSEESLKDEWTQAYLRSIIKTSSIWAVKYKALNLRSLTEKKNMRKTDRALLQMEELIKITEKDESLHKRMRCFYSVLPPARWQVRRNLGDISFDLALFKNALEVYSSIEYWEGIIKCYCSLGQSAKAERIIRQELVKDESPYLYCLLGDVTENIEFYEKAWTISKGRFARAKKSIGTYHYTRKQYFDAIENYKLAFQANPSNISTLSLLAYSCLTVELYEDAAEYYRHLTYLDDSSFLAWNNLSKAYMKMGQLPRAYRTLSQAIKCNYEEWKVWENFMLVSIQIGAVHDVIVAWNRLIDIKSSHRDDQIMEALTRIIIGALNCDTPSNDVIEILNAALKLLARISSTSACSPKVWLCYFKLLILEFKFARAGLVKNVKMTKLDIDSRISKMTNALQRATPNTMFFEPLWHKLPEKVSAMIDSYHELVDHYKFALDTIGYRHELWNQWRHFKLSLNNVIKLLEKEGYRPY